MKKLLTLFVALLMLTLFTLNNTYSQYTGSDHGEYFVNVIQGLTISVTNDDLGLKVAKGSYRDVSTLPWYITQFTIKGQMHEEILLKLDGHSIGAIYEKTNSANLKIIMSCWYKPKDQSPVPFPINPIILNSSPSGTTGIFTFDLKYDAVDATNCAVTGIYTFIQTLTAEYIY